MNSNCYLLLACIVLLSGCRTQKNENEMPVEKIPVRLATVERLLLSRPIHATGFLAAMEESKLSFMIGGILEDISVKEGDRVQKGQMLACLKQNEIEALFNQAKSGLGKAERDLVRAENLYRDSVATLEQTQDARTALELAQSQFHIAEFNLQHSKIIAPSEGKILKTLTERNEMIGPGYPVILFGSGRKDWVLKVGLPDREVVRCKINDPAEVSFDAYPDQIFHAKIAQIAGAPDPMSGLFETELRINPVSVALMTGFIGRVTIFPSDRSMVTVIPISALVNGSGNHGFVYTVKDSVAQKIPVNIAFFMDSGVAIREPLEDVGRVVSEGASYLRQDAEVVMISE